MLNQEQVLEIVPVSHVTLWRMAKAGRFPRGTFISPNKKVWFEDEVIAWQNEVDGRARGWRNEREADDGAEAEAQ
jgi:predicted DNA-binding transcriptional regulator AlpA